METIKTTEVGTKTQLLLDDHVIDDVWMIRRAPEVPVKHLGNPIFPSAGTVIHDTDERIFKMWYSVSIPGATMSLGAYAFSRDGIHWEKPDLGFDGAGFATARGHRYESAGDRNLLHTNGFGPVLKDPHDLDPERRYKMMTKRDGTAESHGGRAFAAFSPDGIHWQDYPSERSIVRNSNDGNGMVVYDEGLGKYINFRRPTIIAGQKGLRPEDIGFPDHRVKKNIPIDAALRDMERDEDGSFSLPAELGFLDEEDFVHHHEAEDFLHRYLRHVPYSNTRALRLWTEKPNLLGCNRRIARAVSDDFIHWSEPEVVIRPDELDPPKLYSMHVSLYKGLYIGLLQVYHCWGRRGYPGCPLESDTIDLHLTFSRDGKHWERLANRPVFIPRGPIGSFDGGMLSGCALFEYRDEIRLYYQGTSHSHNIPSGTGSPRVRGLGAARLPKERLVARVAGEEMGVLLTKPFASPGDSLHLNANAERGLMKVEITDPIGTPIEGFSARDCQEIRVNQLDIPVEWSGGRMLKELAGQPIRLRFYMHQSRLYAFRFDA